MEQTKHDYDTIAVDYENGYTALPTARLEKQLIATALGDLSNLTVLDLGGGGGNHARTAAAQGAAAVDIVDLSPGMMKVAQDIETSLGRTIMRFFEGDAGKSLSHLPLREEGYDVVMTNWLFEYADSPEVLDAMLANVAGQLKSGGKFITIRTTNQHTSINTGQYGMKMKEIRPFPGGLRYTIDALAEPPFELIGGRLDVFPPGPNEVYEKAGLTKVEIVPYEAAGLVQEDPEFWADFLKDPMFVVEKAVRK